LYVAAGARATRATGSRGGRVRLTRSGIADRFAGFLQVGNWGRAMDIRTQIEDALDSIRPALQMDGGDVEFVGFNGDDGVVELRLVGACSSCPISQTTIKHGIERRLKAAVPVVTEVRAVA
jgi:Fe-S cluster biogenesis protein NfuA